MALKLSTGMRNGLCGSLGVKDMLNGGHIKIYTGSQPASPDYAETGTLLVTITSSSGTDGVVLGTQGTGVIPKAASVWSGLIAAAGVAGWFRFHGTGGTTGTSATEVRLDGNVGVSGSDLVLANTSLVLGATLTIDTFTLTQPAS
jgi:hypothetical protein